MKQALEEIEKFYSQKDPWSYKTTPDDQHRKERILKAIPGHYKRVLDIGGGEGWISKDLLADSIEVYEVSRNALKRLPEGILGVTEPTGKYDLIVATGVMYKHYHYETFLNIIKNYGTKTVLVAGIKDWLVDTTQLGSLVYEEEFPYREYTQVIKVYDISLIA